MPRSTPPRRLEDRIRELCTRALHPEEPECSQVIAELRSAIQEQTLRLENLAAAAAVAGKPDLIRERRQS